MTVSIPLTQGLSALIDDEDALAVLAAGKWCASTSKRSRTAYAVRAVRREDGVKTVLPLHRFLTGWAYVDHINGNGLDNRRANLRQSDQSQNNANMAAPRTNSSGFKGVSWHAGGRKWMAKIQHRGQQIYLGLFDDPVEAAKAYDQAAQAYYGDFARPNFPEAHA